MKTKYIILNLFFLIFSLIPFLKKDQKIETEKNSGYDEYNIQLNQINSIEKSIAFIEKNELKNNSKLDTLKYVLNASEFVKKRFYHGVSRYTISENWIACLSGFLIWDHFSAIVNPDHILKHNKALCSQQSIVFMEILKRKGITTRFIGLGEKGKNGHFVNEVYYNNSWHFFDVNKEPHWGKINIKHESAEFYKNNPDYLIKIYEKILDKKDIMKLINHINYGEPNEFPAKKMLLFHFISKLFTYFIPLIFFTFLIIGFIKNFKNKPI